jgi:hypothetical protein
LNIDHENGGFHRLILANGSADGRLEGLREVTVFLPNHPSYTKPLKYQLCRGLRELPGCKPHLNYFEDFTMSAPSHGSTASTDHSTAEQDAVEAIVPLMPIVLPLVGAVTMLLIAFIAVFMA